MKFKPKKSDEYVIVGFNEEMSKYGEQKGALGSLICTGSDGEEFRVGTGFDQGSRKRLWDRREDLIGKICKVSYQHLTPGKKVPRFPVFVSIEDKMEVIEDGM